MTLCLVEEIPAFANERGSGAFPESCCGIFGDQMCVETDENDTKSWNDRPSGDTIESTDRMGGRNTIYLGNVGGIESFGLRRIFDEYRWMSLGAQ